MQIRSSLSLTALLLTLSKDATAHISSAMARISLSARKRKRILKLSLLNLFSSTSKSIKKRNLLRRVKKTLKNDQCLLREALSLNIKD